MIFVTSLSDYPHYAFVLTIGALVDKLQGFGFFEVLLLIHLMVSMLLLFLENIENELD